MLSESLVNSIQQLILLGRGDRGRLEYILELITKGKALPMSDQKYLESIIPLYLGAQDLESIQKHTEQIINTLYGEIRALNERLQRFEKRGFEKYVGKKAVLFFATVFMGWHALQNSIMFALGQYLPYGTEQYLFPLNTLANNFGQIYLVWWIFVFMALAWPFIGATHLSRFIRSRKISSHPA